ncbi:hypothetical protein [Spirillospora sp. CA-294931]|uniref:hypothetical protein n=1 Tax=Spirillospora sp. CA-294931 TaxID=3240042 RepID=UPI003D8A5454
MSGKVVYFVGGVAVTLIVLNIFGTLIASLILLGIIAVPVAGYLMLDPSQRKRVRGQARKRIGS